MYTLSGKIAIVTGASRSKGIGTAICYALADAGADIFFTHFTPFDREEKRLEKGWPARLHQRLKKMGVRSAHMEIDFTDKCAPDRLLKTVEEELGTASILVNNATFEKQTNYKTLTADVLDKHYKVNNRGPIMLCTEFAKRYEKKFSPDHGGRIINLVSGGPDPDNLAYIATKGTIRAMTYPLSVGLAKVGITVNSVDPGPTDSGWITDDLREQFIPLFPSGRIGVPKDAAKLVRFIASPESEWVTGQIIDSNGGFLGK